MNQIWRLYLILRIILSCNCNLHSPIQSAPSPIRDVVILGSGPAGSTAAIYTSRALLKPLIISGFSPGGQLCLTSDVENFPGYPDGIGGPELMGEMFRQAQRFGAEFWQANCQKLDLSCYPFKVYLNNGTVEAKSIIVATGAESRWLNAEGESLYKGNGISTCATCDGALFKDEDVVVVGGGDSALEEALFITRFAKKVTLVHRREEFRASKVMQERARSNRKIRILTNRVVNRWVGTGSKLTGVELLNIADNTREKVDCEGAFISIGHTPNTHFINNDQIQLDSEGYISVSPDMMTTVPGVFACGDVVDKRHRQAITAAGSGCQAALEAEKWLEEQTAGRYSH